MKSSNLKLIEHTDMRPVHSNGRKANAAYRVREHLTEGEMDNLLAALKRNRYGLRDWLIGLLIYRHGLRVSEACDLRWDDINLGRIARLERPAPNTEAAPASNGDDQARLQRIKSYRPRCG